MNLPHPIRAWLTRHPRFARRFEQFNRRRRMWITLFILFCHLAGALTSVHMLLSESGC